MVFLQVGMLISSYQYTNIENLKTIFTSDLSEWAKEYATQSLRQNRFRSNLHTLEGLYLM